MRKKPWKKALIALVTIPVILGLLWLLSMIYYGAQEMYGKKLMQTTKKIASVELINQKKPLVFFELMEQPPIKGVKVKITYEDGGSKVVNAYNVKSCHYDEYASYKGMYFKTRTRHDNSRSFEPFLEPGLHSIEMYYINDTYNLHEDFYNENPPNIGYCMVEVYAQTAEEYIAERKPPVTTVTESREGKLSLRKGKRCLVKLLAKESGTYLLQVGGDCRLDTEVYTGSGSLFYGEDGCYAQLNANEPLYLRVEAMGRGHSSLQASLTRVPEDEANQQ